MGGLATATGVGLVAGKMNFLANAAAGPMRNFMMASSPQERLATEPELDHLELEGYVPDDHKIMLTCNSSDDDHY